VNTSMNIAIIGYGKMGKSIEKEALKLNHQIIARIDDQNFSPNDLTAADVAIEFSQPAVAVDNIKTCFEANLPVVVGTTGWYQHYDEVCKLARDKNQTLFTATNFSIGVNLLFHINLKFAQLMNQFPQYDIQMTETHHLEKLDHPSGTASTLAQDIIKSVDRKINYIGLLENEQKQLSTSDLSISCKREENVPGFHQITYSSDIDEISISHNAKNRNGFTQGAIMAAEWVKDKKGIFTMNDLLKF